MSGLGRTERDHGAVYDYMSAPTALPAQTPDDPHAWVEVARTPDARTTRHMALVLQSMNVPHGIAQMEDGQALLVRRAQAAYAPNNWRAMNARTVAGHRVSPGSHLCHQVVRRRFCMAACWC